MLSAPVDLGPMGSEGSCVEQANSKIENSEVTIGSNTGAVNAHFEEKIGWSWSWALGLFGA